MVIESEMIKWIDNATYEQLLKKWRFAPSGDPFFEGATGEYYTQKMRDKRKEIGNDAQVAASKRIGWEPNRK